MKSFFYYGVFNTSFLIANILLNKLVFFLIGKDALNVFFFHQAIALSIASLSVVPIELTFQYFIPKHRDMLGNILFVSLLIYTLSYSLSGFVVGILMEFELSLVFLLFPVSMHSILIALSRADDRIAYANFLSILPIVMVSLLILRYVPENAHELANYYFLSYTIATLPILLRYPPKLRGSLKTLKRILPYMSQAFLSSIPSPFIRHVDRIILQFFSPNDLAGFTLVRRIDQFARQILNSFTIWLIPRASRYGKRIYGRYLAYYMLVSMMLFAGVLFLAEYILKLLAHETYVAYAPYLRVFLVALPISSYYSFKLMFLRLSGNIRTFRNFNFVSGAIYTCLGITLAYLWGIWGIVVSFVITHTVLLLLSLRIRF